MALDIADSQIHDMSVDERLELIERLWESLDVGQPGWPITPEQERELDRRLDLLDRGLMTGAPADEVFARLRART